MQLCSLQPLCFLAAFPCCSRIKIFFFFSRAVSTAYFTSFCCALSPKCAKNKLAWSPHPDPGGNRTPGGESPGAFCSVQRRAGSRWLCLCLLPAAGLALTARLPSPKFHVRRLQVSYGIAPLGLLVSQAPKRRGSILSPGVGRILLARSLLNCFLKCSCSKWQGKKIYIKRPTG